MTKRTKAPSDRADLPGCGGLPFASIDPGNPERLLTLYRSWLLRLQFASDGTRDVAPEWLDGGYGFLRFYSRLAETWFPGAQLARRRRDPETGEVILTDGDLPYGPGCCEWATAEDNRRDREKRRGALLRRYEIDGEEVSVREAAERVGLPPRLVSTRLCCGWCTWDELRLPPGAHRDVKRYGIDGLGEMTLRDLHQYAQERGLPADYDLLKKRLSQGVRDPEALFAPPQHQNRLGAGRLYEIEGELLHRNEVKARVPEAVRYLVSNRLSYGCRTWAELSRGPRGREVN